MSLRKPKKEHRRQAKAADLIRRLDAARAHGFHEGQTRICRNFEERTYRPAFIDELPGTPFRVRIRQFVMDSVREQHMPEHLVAEREFREFVHRLAVVLHQEGVVKVVKDQDRFGQNRIRHSILVGVPNV